MANLLCDRDLRSMPNVLVVHQSYTIPIQSHAMPRFPAHAPKHHAAAYLTIFAIFAKKYLEIEEIFV